MWLGKTVARLQGKARRGCGVVCPSESNHAPIALHKAPYLELLFTSTGILYAILVTPSPLAYARKLDAHGQLVAHQPPLAGLPVWLLNSFIFAAPVAVSVAVLIPGIRLILACKRMELFGIHVVFATVEAFAMDYAKGIVPAIADQAAFLESLAQAAAYRQESVSRWSPLYGIW